MKQAILLTMSPSTRVSSSDAHLQPEPRDHKLCKENTQCAEQPNHFHPVFNLKKM